MASTSTSSTPPPSTAPDWTFPATLKTSVSHWWASSGKSAGLQAELDLLSRGLASAGIGLRRALERPAVGAAQLPEQEYEVVLEGKQGGKVATLQKVQLSGGKHRFLNLLEVAQPGANREEEHNLVVLHGYGSGIPFLFQNFAAICGHPNTRVFALDWLGMGRSGRPSFPTIKPVGPKGSWQASKSRVTQAEDFFLDALEEFREKKGLDKMTLVGHSLGGYLSVAYTLKYPQHVQKLVLVSPVGVPEAPYELPSETEHGTNADDLLAAEFANTPQEARATQHRDGSPPPPPTPTGSGKPKPPNTWWSYLWEQNISPFQVVRFSTVFGPRLVSIYATRRFALFPADQQRELFEYLYQICRERGSGEFALSAILAPGAYARWPLVGRMKDLKVPVTFLYGGSNDWMDRRGGDDVLKAIKARKPKAGEEAWDALQKKRSKVLINEHSGHWVFLDNPAGFNTLMQREIKDAVEDWKAAKAVKAAA